MAFDKVQDFSDRSDDVSAWGWWDERDQIFGGSGDDFFEPGEGDDEVHGGAGNDDIADATYSYNALLIVPFLPFVIGYETDGAGADMEDLFATPPDRSNLRDAHESGDDVFFGDAGDDVLVGYSGNDTLDGGADSDMMWGGLGNDRILGGSGVDGMFGNQGDDFLSGGADRDIMYGGSGDDILLGGSGNDLLNGGTGADFLQGGLGADQIRGGDLAANAFAGLVTLGLMSQAQANAAVAAANTGDTVNYDNSIFAVNVDLERATQTGGDAEGDTITGVENIDGSRGGDTLRGDNKANTLFGNFGNDTLEGRGGADTLEGGIGSDTASYESSSSRVNVDLIRGTGQLADAAGDTYNSIENITGSRFDDTLSGDDALGGNRIEGGDGRDTIDGRGGNDVLDGGLGDDTLIGGLGTDTAEFDSWDTPASGGGVLFIAPKVTIDLASGVATKAVFSFQTFGYDVVETDTLTSIENARGSNNADLFIGNTQNNVFCGGAGNDTFRADAGSDTYNGDSGVDTVDYTGSSAVTVNLNVGVAGIGGLAAGDLYNSIENVIGTSGKDFITGNNADNRLTGAADDDTINGRGGDDVIVGGTETATESLAGGAGRDTFLYLSRADSFTTGKHTGDIIADFNTDEDLIDLRALNVDADDLKFSDFVDANGLHRGQVFEDLNGNDAFDANELNINLVLIGGSAEFSLLDVLV